MPEETVYICDLYPDCNRAASGKKSASATVYIAVAGDDGKVDETESIDKTGNFCSKPHAARFVRGLLKGA